MMKKIFLLVLGFVMFKVGYSQYPIQQYIGADSAVVTSKGGLQGRLINQVFADTTAANSQRIKQYPGAMIYASGKLWLRNSTATGWSEIAQGQISNIYNSNGTLTGSRELDGNGYPLLFTAVRKFQVSADTVDFLPFNGQLFSNLNQGSGTKAVRYNPSTRLFTYADTTSSLSGYVPYTGATQNVNLGQYGLKSEYVEFDTTLRAPADRTLSWSNDDGTLYLGMTNGGTITQRIGLEQFARVKNVDTVTITKGQAVYIYGASGDRASVKRASNKGDATSSKTLGIAAENIAVNGVGLVGTFGVVQNLNLGAYTAGNILYLDSIPGQLTATKPQAPYHIVFVGVVERANAGNGLLFVNPQNGYELDELHNVLITSPVRNNAILAYDSVAQLWKDTTLSAIGGVSGSGTTNYLSKWTSSSALGNSLVYDNGTNVGVNTASPSATYKLDISGATRILDGTPSIIVDNAQTYKIDINGLFKIRDGATNYLLISAGNLTFPNGGIFSNSINIGANSINTLSGVLAFSMGSAGGTERMRLTNSGRLLIGTTTESTYELDVVGDIRSTLDANINGLTVGKGGGQLATNTAVGFEALNATNTGGNNVAIGYRALKAYTGDGNVAIGTNALTSNTTGNTNTAIGTGAGQLITTANKNTIIGYAAGNSNVSSHNNTYIGYYAGVSATGNANTIVGSEAAFNLTTGVQNTFIGNAAGRAVNTGGTNTLLGYFAGYGLTTGSENVLIGNNTMASASTASSNTLVGAYAGNVLTGSSNTFVGWYSGVSATSSVYNVGIGSGALQNITTGGYNTAIGHRAGRFFGAATSSNTTGTQGIFIGYQSRASADGNTNETVIGYDALGNGSNTVTIGNSSVTATYLGGSVSTSQPSATGAGKWKLGKKISATVALVTTDYIEVDIDGVVYKLALVN